MDASDGPSAKDGGSAPGTGAKGVSAVVIETASPGFPVTRARDKADLAGHPRGGDMTDGPRT